MSERAHITELLAAAERGDAHANDALFARVYGELRRIARGHVRRAGNAIDINPTTLLHEAWIKFSRSDHRALQGSAHFYNLIAQAMRHVLIDLARKHATDKHGRGMVRTELTDSIEQADRSIDELLAIDVALVELRNCDPELAQLVEWHFFAGISFVDIATARAVTERTVRRHWELARTFLADAVRTTDVGS